MAKTTFDKQLTALLMIDPYNDFVSEGGKYGSLKGFAEANKCVEESVWALIHDWRASAVCDGH